MPVLHCYTTLKTKHFHCFLLQALYINSSIDEKGEPVEEEEDHTYELLLTAQSKVPPPSHNSHKGNKEDIVLVSVFIYY